MQTSRNESDIWHVSRLLSWMTDYFSEKNIESPRLSAELLLCMTLDCNRVNLYTSFDKPLEKHELDFLKKLIMRRAAFEPVSYITGEKGFLLYDFFVSRDVLIPRPDTERLVEVVFELFSEKKSEKIKILELGTGSGAISISLADYFKNCLVVSTDISFEAIKIAVKNSLKYGVEKKIIFVNTSWFNGLSNLEKFDLIVSNPPYIRRGDIDSLQPEIRKYEPFKALDGGIDGLDCIREIIGTAGLFLKNNGFLIIEAGHDQKEDIEKITEKTKDLFFEEMIKDYGKRDRVAVIKKKSVG